MMIMHKEIKRNILLNPGPATTTDSVKQAMVVPDICPREKEFGLLVEGIRNDLVKIIHGEKTHEAILFGCSGTGVVEACLSSVVPEGKTVLIASNGAYGERMKDICERYNIGHQDYDEEWGKPLRVSELESFLSRFPTQISHVAFVHHETTVGILNPLPQIAELCQHFGVELIVDAMSSYAGLPIDLRRDQVHYVISSANKCLQGMAGVSFVIAHRDSLEKTSLVKKRSLYLSLFENFVFQKKTLQMQFTPPVQLMYALRQSVDEYFQEGGQVRFERYGRLYEILREGLLTLGFKFLVETEYHSRLLTAILEPQHENYSFEGMHDYLYLRGFTIYPGKIKGTSTFRLANIGEIYPEDIKEFLRHLGDYLREYRIRMA